MEWDFFRSKLSLSDLQSLKIREILSKLQNEIKEINSLTVLDEESLTLESISTHAAISHGMDETFLESQCKGHTLRERDSGGKSSLTDVEKIVSEKQNEIMLLLSKSQQNRFKQMIRIKPITEINTGYSPLRDKRGLLLEEKVRKHIKES